MEREEIFRGCEGECMRGRAREGGTHTQESPGTAGMIKESVNYT